MPLAVGRPRQFELELTRAEAQALQAMAASRLLPHSHVRRAQITLASAAGEPSSAIANRLGLTAQTIGHWRTRFRAQRLTGLPDAPQAGRSRTHDDERVAGLLRTVLETKPLEGDAWRVRPLAAETGINTSVVQRDLSLFGVQPHRTKSFTRPTDPFFVEKVRGHRRPPSQPAGSRTRPLRG